ncbi:MAG TPA: MFS transporter [Anaeromyxobacter sp.]|nr:MFS transporter [Anaeromyxobacter sp.]
MAPDPNPLRHSFRALRHRNFRLFLAGQFVSLIGTWLQSVALGWLLYRLTHSAWVLGLAGFLTQIPSLLLSPLAGVWADRWNRHRMVIGTQTLAMVQAVALAALVLTGHEAILPILLLNLLLGVANAADVPARQSFVIEMVSGGDDLPNAIALNSSVFNLARLAGPALAGPLIALLGEGKVFLLNGLSYLAVIAALLAIRVPESPHHVEPTAEVWAHLREGLDYVVGFAPIRAVLVLLATINLVGTPTTVLLPIFAGDVFRGGAHTYGYLVGAIGVGALCGALYMASRRSVVGLGRLIALAVTLFSASLLGLSLCRRERLAVPVLAVTGFGMMVHMASSNTLVQTLVDPSKRGRVMSFYAVAFMGMAPIGSLFLGALASRIGAPLTAALSGATCLAAAATFARKLPALRAEVHPLYARMGVMPEVVKSPEASEAEAIER